MYEYSILPFSTALSPHVFTSVTQAAATPLRAMGIRLNAYLYDWSISTDARQEVSCHTEMVASHLTDLGFLLNPVKANGADSADHLLGVQLGFTSMLGRLSEQEK